jgi:replicative DNA helicase Mcm
LESMEQQTVSVAKAGIIATLNTRTSVLAAANPELGRFDEYRSLTEQIKLPAVIMSRFDLIFIMRDEPLEERDRNVARHMLELHHEPEKVVKPPLDIETLRKIIIYARKYIDPEFKSTKPMKVLEDFFVQWRKIAERGAIPITARQLEGLVRLTKANARMRLSNTVTVEDANRAIKLIKLSLQQAGIDPETGEVDIDVIMTGRSKSQRERFERVLEIIRGLEDDYGGAAPVDEVKRIAVAEGIKERFVENMIEQEKTRGHLYEPKQGMIKRAVG